MKPIKILMYSSLFILLFGCENKKTDLEKNNLNGKVKSVKENKYKAVDKFGKDTKRRKAYF